MDDQFPGINKSFSKHEASYRDFASFVVVEHAIHAAYGVHSDIPLPAPNVPLSLPEGEQIPSIEKVGIVGAGVSGLYAAMILEDLGIPYEILEANERIGGRIYTHRFNGDVGKKAPVNDPARYDYYDVGAMRFPRISFMDRVFDLFKRVKIDHLLIEYKLSAQNTLMYYNTRPPLNPNNPSSKSSNDYFHVSRANKGTVPDTYVDEGPDHWIDGTFGYFVDLFKKVDKGETPAERRVLFGEAWDELMKQDHSSTRGYMLASTEGKPPGALDPFPGSVVEWLETFGSATGLYDLAFSESVMDSLDFGTTNASREPKPLNNQNNPCTTLPGQIEWDWVCIDGGSDRMIDGMLSNIKKHPITHTRVTKIEPTDTNTMIVYDSTGTKRVYSQVILTAPLGCIGGMDLDKCELLWNQKLAIRSLQYDASTKVGIKFATRWWEDPAFMHGFPIRGGVSDTDVPIRVCVYPSYGMDCPPETPPPGILLASYTWAQDARRIGSLAHGKGTEADKVLLELVLDNICKLHNIPRSVLPPVIDHFAFDWYHDQYARGAFALFGPAQFGYASSTPKPEPVPESMFVSLKAPVTQGKLHFAGEATSAHHAWVLGSLNSAWRAVYNALEGHPQLQRQLKDQWGIPDEETEIELKKLSLLSRYHAL